ncbi:hypothetical protein K439DRAFT_1661296 [Ramaria rubella]|nr:hypothetical protein K439DRAFT_1661296 [Ramaria rubella]
MSAYKSYTPRRPTESTESSSNDKLKAKVEKLQELFPSWSYEGTLSVVTETAGDVELAVARISEGHAEQWGSVTRKRDKKTVQPSQSTSSFSSRGDRDRPSGDFRGGRGGRGGRGRGGGGRGTSRAGHASGHHREAGASTSGTNGTVTLTSEAAPVNNDVIASTTAVSNDWGTETKANGVGPGPGDPWVPKPTTNDTHEAAAEGWTAPIEPPAASSSAGWGGESAAEAISAPAWVAETATPDAWPSSQSTQNGTSELAKTKAHVKTSKVPAGAKLSWAQIARAQEKPKTVVATPPTQPLAPPVPPASTESRPSPASEELPPAQDQEQGWEEPTTVQPPTWDDEQPSLPLQAEESQVSPAHDGWITADTVPPPSAPQEAWDTSATFSTEVALQEAATQDSTWNPPQPEEKASIPSPQVTTPSIASIAPSSSVASVATSTAPTSKPSTPSVAHASARSLNAHRSSARYPKSDQAVVIPAFAGSIGAGGEKLGMQFGSLSIGGDDFDGTFKTEAEQPASLSPEQRQQQPQQQSQPQPQQQSQPQSQQQPQQQPLQPHQASASVQTQPHDAVPSPAVPVSSHTQNFFQQASQPTSQIPPVAQQISPSQPSQSQQQPASAGPPFGSHQPPPALTHHQQQQQLAQQHHQPQAQHSYVQQQQHGIHTHFDGPPATQQQQQPQQQQHTTGPQTGSYFRQPESPYYHTPTPPQSAPPDHQGAYATTFSPLGVGAGAHGHAQGLGGQGQGSHLGAFGAGGPGEYGYGDGQRGFYDYAQPGSFSNRLVHEEPSKSGLPISQGSQPTSSLSAAAGQPQPSSGPQGSSSQPPTGQQGQQQSYPAPMPYYYPPYYPQNSYPSYPNPSYGQAYMPKYPPVYPHQAPPGSAPPPASKGPSATAPYSASASQSHLYHGQSGFEDPSSGYQHHQGSTNLGNTDYSKPPHHQQQQQPLYGAQASQGLQSFLGIQQTPGSGQGVGGPGNQQRSGTSPETSYKPYGTPGVASDKSGAGIGAQTGQQGRGAGVQQTQQQAGGTGSFYPGGRFSGSAGGPQQQGQQQSYPQSAEQGQFYPYQPRHQGGYWQ